MVFAAFFGFTLNAGIAVLSIISFLSVEKGVKDGLLSELPAGVISAILYGLVCGMCIFGMNSYILFLFLSDLLSRT
jgi:hypothetical protein